MPSTRLRLKQLHYDLYEKSRKEALSYPGFKSKSILAYARDYYDSLPKTFKKVDLLNLLSSIRSSQVVLYGDFHTLKQCQKGFVRLLGSLTDSEPKPNLVVFVEMFRSKDQEFIDSFLDNSIDETKFLQLINYQQSWGFPWENYAMIMDFCKHHNIHVLGLNSNRLGKDSLKRRDDFAAMQIRKYRAQNPDTIICCLVGEFHLGDHSLYKRLCEKDIPVTRVFNNVDDYYFSPQASISHQTEYLLLKPMTYCILNAPPWIKWQSYCLWEETRAMIAANESIEHGDEDEELLYTEDCIDIDAQIGDLIDHLCGFWNLGEDCPKGLNFSVELNPGEEELLRFQSHYNLKNSELNVAIERLSRDGYFFDGYTKKVLLSDLSLNNLSRVSGRIIHRSFSQDLKNDLEDSQDFALRCLSFASGELAGLIMNPKIKYRDISYFAERLNKSKGRSLRGSAKVHRAALKKLISIQKLMMRRMLTHKELQEVAQKDSQYNHELSLLLGVILGHQVYQKCVIRRKDPVLMINLIKSASHPQRSPQLLNALLKSTL